MPIIRTEGLSKTFKRLKKEEGLKGTLKALVKRTVVEKTALDRFDLEIDEGEFVGLIGPNGAGKTTLVKMLCGIIQPTTGAAEVMGFTPGMLKDEFRRKFAVVMGQKSQLWWDLPAIDTFTLNKEIYGIPDRDFHANITLFGDIFGIGDLLNIPVRNLSLGERMKMELVAALLHDPRVLFLDEPTIGLDAIAQKQIRLFLKRVNEEKGVTVMLTSHYMEDIRNLCKRTVVINSGRKIYDGPLDSLLNQFQDHRIIHVSFETETEPVLGFPVEWIDKNPFNVVFKIERGLVKPVLQTILSAYEVDDIRIEEDDIATVVERIYSAGKEDSGEKIS